MLLKRYKVLQFWEKSSQEIEENSNMKKTLETHSKNGKKVKSAKKLKKNC